MEYPKKRKISKFPFSDNPVHQQNIGYNEAVDDFKSVIKEIVICAAIKTTNGKVIRGHRHCHCIATAKAMGLDRETKIDSQGFITSRNRFVTRSEGRKLQDLAGIKSVSPDGYRSGTLFSEDLY